MHGRGGVGLGGGGGRRWVGGMEGVVSCLLHNLYMPVSLHVYDNFHVLNLSARRF